MENCPYRIDYTPSYTTDDEYREAIRILFRMSFLKSGAEDDEYDDVAVTKSLDYIYELTGELPGFQELYNAAAGKMMSEDPQFGIALLFAYDYLAEFHAILVAYFAKENVEDRIAALKEKLV